MNLIKMAKTYMENPIKLNNLLKKHKETENFTNESVLLITTELNKMQEEFFDKNQDVFFYAAKIKDFNLDFDGNLEGFEYYYDTAIYNVKEKQTYSSMGFIFAELANMPIWENSLLVYDEDIVYLELIFELSWFGYTEEEADNNQNKFFKELDESVEECKDSNNIETLNMEDLRDKLGLPAPKDKNFYRENLLKYSNEINKYNKLEFDKLNIVTICNKGGKI